MDNNPSKRSIFRERSESVNCYLTGEAGCLGRIDLIEPCSVGFVAAHSATYSQLTVQYSELPPGERIGAMAEYMLLFHNLHLVTSAVVAITKQVTMENCTPVLGQIGKIS
jgi:hypothetical protein